MKNYICATCGTIYEIAEKPPNICSICEDERQYVGLDGQKWTILEELNKNYKNIFEDKEPGVISIKTLPDFAIGQRAFLVKSKQGNILWDCVTLINEETINKIKKLGGLIAIAISHPHYYSAMTQWSAAFGNIPLYIHKDDSRWVMCGSENINFWKGENYQLNDELTMIRCGGHFEGASVLHWKSSVDGKGVIFSGDTIQVVPDRKHVSFMYSYPNIIPLNKQKIQKIIRAVEPFEFDRIYGAFQQREILKDAKNAVLKSAGRYIKAIE